MLLPFFTPIDDFRPWSYACFMFSERVTHSRLSARLFFLSPSL
nr:MAG TPA: hypothetical protein [Caudoviricetes sp.]